ncbi:MAG: NUDIX domain-containing protein, partial [Candidatus Uhrbacteria bacterium]|nr:NUDIX domain-containing protein [Candidatus Uhrbacteria bacterium]
MSHIHEKIDFTVSCYIVHDQKVLLVDHRELKKWLPIGGHIELDEDPDKALQREITEECGLEVEIMAEKPGMDSPGTKFLYRPSGVNIHDINPTHRHVVLVYYGRALTFEPRLAPDEHAAIRWFTREDLRRPE